MSMRWKIAQAAEKKWWQKYLKKKDPADYLEWKRDYWNNFLQKLNINPIDNQRCLDLGCGPAGVFIALDHQVVEAVDPLMEEYKDLPHFEPKNYPQVCFIRSKMEDYQPEHTFDLLFCLNAINHVDDWEASMHKLFKLVGPGGELIVSTDVHKRPWMKYPFRLIQGDILHPQQHSRKDYEDFFQKHYPQFELLENQVMKEDFFFEYRVYRLRALK